MVPAAASSASIAAAESGARPRLVCSTTPVAFSTGRIDPGRAGSAGERRVRCLCGVLRGQVAGAHAREGGHDGVLDGGPAQTVGRRRQAGVREHGVRARDAAARVTARGGVGHAGESR